jgi:hypothetical protein
MVHTWFVMKIVCHSELVYCNEMSCIGSAKVCSGWYWSTVDMLWGM